MSLLPIDSIDIGERFRRDMGDLPALAASIDRVGLLHPVVVMGDPDDDRRWRLVAGERRLRACRDILHWERIHVRIVNGIDLLQAEHDENAVREPFTPSEAVAIAAALRPVEKAAAQERQGTRTDLTPEPPANVAEGGESRKRIASAVGMSHTTLAKAEAVVEAATTNPALAPIVEAMDDSGNVAGSLAAVQALAPDPAPEQVQAAAEAVRERRTAELVRTAGERLAGTPEVREKDRALRFAKAMRRHSEAQYDLSAEHWQDGLDRSDIDAMRGHIVVARRWIETWQQALEGTSVLRIVGGSK